MTRTVAITLTLLAAACTPSTDDDSNSSGRQSPMAAIEAGIHGDATCQELFDRRNGMDPSDPNVERANEMFRDIGCFSSGSTRTDR